MFFFLSKTLDVALEPLWWVVALVAAGVFFLARAQARKRLGLGLVSSGLVVLFAGASRPVAHGLQHLAEADVTATWRPDASYDVVVLLGGMVDHGGLSVAMSDARGDRRPEYSAAVDRLLVTYDLLREDRARYVIASGGAAFPGGPSEARVLTAQLAAWGIAPERLIAEERALNTRQNAKEVAAVMAARGMSSALLVTSAFHMHRAAGCFRAEGVPFDTLPVDFHMRDPSRWHDWLPRTEYLLATSQMLREFFGRWTYAVLGYTK